jgi:hypothetical protein
MEDSCQQNCPLSTVCDLFSISEDLLLHPHLTAIKYINWIARKIEATEILIIQFVWKEKYLCSK